MFCTERRLLPRTAQDSNFDDATETYDSLVAQIWIDQIKSASVGEGAA